MHIHFLGICGTFMGSLALLAREMGHQVSGCDANVYPPMSTQLAAAGVVIVEGYSSSQFESRPELIIIGNAMSRGNEAVEYVLDNHLPYCSGPQWLSDNVLQDKWVLAVAGTHGKTTTSSMLAWILEYAGLKPGFLIGGLPNNFEYSARLGESDFFVIEADEYDTAFFDKRSKFVHYHPRTLVLNNLEYDHADIFPNIEAIETQFHHLVRILPSTGLLIYPESDVHLKNVIAKGCWSEQAILGRSDSLSDWCLEPLSNDGSRFRISNQKISQDCEIAWDLIGDHNVANAYSACVAALHVGVPLAQSALALNQFKGVKRRMELLAELTLAEKYRVRIYDDFAHHPTAIALTLSGLRAQAPLDKIIAVIEPRSNTMRMGGHGTALQHACDEADEAYWYLDENASFDLNSNQSNVFVFQHLDLLVLALQKSVKLGLEASAVKESKTHIVIMSNGSFGGVHQNIMRHLEAITH